MSLLVDLWAITLLPLIPSLPFSLSITVSVISTLDCWFHKNSTGHHCIISAGLRVGIRSMVRFARWYNTKKVHLRYYLSLFYGPASM